MAHPGPLFVFFRSFKFNFTEKFLDYSGIRTQIVGVEGDHADHLTTTTALNYNNFNCLPNLRFCKWS